MDKWELSHWIALLRMEPSVTRAVQVEQAYTRATIANAAYGSKGGHKLNDWALEYDPADAEQQHKGPASNTWKHWAAMAGGSIKGR